MKRSFMRTAAIVLSMSIVSIPLPTNHRYGNIIKKAEIAAHAEDKWVKSSSNTTLGTIVINSPQPSGTNKDGWAGDYVYFGKYDRTKNNYVPIQYRVLDKDTTYFSEGQIEPIHTMLLDCNTVLCNLTQSQCQSWSECDARTWLNGTGFRLNSNYFSVVEKNSIALSTKTKAVSDKNRQDGVGRDDSTFSPLNGDYIFFLDSKEITNESYGYGIDGKTRIKTGKSKLWWSRSFTPTKFVYNNSNGGFGIISCSSSYESGVSPAFNVSLDSIVFSSVVTASSNTAWGNKYKLTLKDSNTVLASGSVSNDGNTITVPFTISDLVTNDGITANRVSVVIVGESNKIKLYEKLNTGNENLDLSNGTAFGTGTFTLPESYNSSTDKIYILAEDVHEGDDYLLTDYASELVEISIPVKMTPLMYVSADSSRLLLNILVPIAEGYSSDDYTVTFADVKQNLATVKNNGINYGKFTVECAAKEMSDEFPIVISADDTEIYTSNVSVKSYLDEIITNEQYSKYCAAAKAMMRYGATAQLYFQHNTTNLVNSDSNNDEITGAEISELPDKLDITSPTRDDFSEAFDLQYSDYYAMNMTFTSDTTLLIAFKVKGDSSDEVKNELETKFKNNEYTINVIQDNSGDFYIVRVENIPIKKLGEPIFTFGNVDVKATDYLSRIANNPDKPDDLRDLCKSLYAYYTAAKAL